MTPDELDQLGRQIIAGLSEAMFTMPPALVKYMEPFRGYMPPPVAIGYGPDYVMMLTSISENGVFIIQFKAPDGAQLWNLVMKP